MPAVEKAAEYVNAIETDKKLEGVATILYIIQRHNGEYDLNAVVKQFKNWSEDKEKRFSDEEIIECLNYLENTEIVLKNICGLCSAYNRKKCK